jgi:hypothetical protein
VTPRRQQLAIWIVIVTLAAATIWRAKSSAASTSKLPFKIPKDVSALLALMAPPASDGKAAEQFRYAQLGVVSYLLDGSNPRGFESLAQVGIDETQPILACAIGRFGLAPRKIRRSEGGYASLPQNWILLLPVRAPSEFIQFFVRSRGASVSKKLDGDVLSTISFKEAKLAFPVETAIRERLKGLIGTELPSYTELYFAPVNDQYCVLGTSRECVEAALVAENGGANWRALLAQILKLSTTERGKVYARINPSLFPGWKSFTGFASFAEGTIRVSIEAEVGSALASEFSPRRLSFPRRRESRSLGVDAHVELAPEHVAELSASPLVRMLCDKLFQFDDQDEESFDRFRKIVTRLSAPAKVGESAQIYLTRGRLGSPGWVLGIPSNRNESIRIATEIQREFFIERATHDAGAVIDGLSPETKAALAGDLGANRFYVPISQLVERIPAEAADLRKWNGYSIELETGEIDASAGTDRLSEVMYREKSDEISIEYLTPAFGPLDESDDHDENTRRRHPAFCFDDSSGRLFFGDAPESLREALVYSKSALLEGSLTDASDQTVVRIKCSIGTSVEHSVALEEKAWLARLATDLARFGVQNVEGDLKLVGKRLMLSLSLH